jgi:hypothetical protein
MGTGNRPEPASASFLKRLGQAGLVVALVAGPAVYMTWRVLSQTVLECEVCIEFRGARQCRRAEGPDRESCQRTATDNACAFLASGMTDSIACSRTSPSSVEFSDSEGY